MPVHKDCANFSNGFCSFYGTPVDPNGQACANFVPRTQQPAQVPPPAPQPVLGMGRKFRRRRRARRRRGKGWLRIWPF